ncbi:MAG TPA: sigma-54 dependent transcriptional regulator [Myxococcota bacterium]
MSRILLVDDDPDYSFALQHLLSRGGHDVAVATAGGIAVDLVTDTPIDAAFDVALVDLTLPDIHGLNLLDALFAVDPHLSVICLTGSHDTTSVVQAMRKGAVDYITKPADKATLSQAVATATSTSRARRATHGHHGASIGDRGVVGSSPAWRQLLAQVQAASSSSKTTVLVTGETGSGKEVTATLLHALSARRKGPLITANAASFSPPLVESELFGHEAGAFTGAVKRRRGLFEQADHGILFLDEIGELALDVQATLLRVLEGHPFRRVGGEEAVRVDVRLVAATNRDLPQMVKDGRFRADLLERLRVFSIHVPPLRERSDDVDMLAAMFVEKLGAALDKASPGLTPEAMAALRAHPWPGNVRELKNVVERALVVADGAPIAVRHLAIAPPATLSSSSSSSQAVNAMVVDDDASMEAVTRQHIVNVFNECNGNVTHTAEKLGMSRLAVRKRLQSYGLRPRA